MNGGSPPTAPKARAGLFTPPGITRLARAKASWLRGSRKSGRDRAGVGGSIVSVASAFGVQSACSESRSGFVDQLVPARDVEHTLDSSSSFSTSVIAWIVASNCASGGPNCLRPRRRREPPGFLGSSFGSSLRRFL